MKAIYLLLIISLVFLIPPVMADYDYQELIEYNLVGTQLYTVSGSTVGIQDGNAVGNMWFPNIENYNTVLRVDYKPPAGYSFSFTGGATSDTFVAKIGSTVISTGTVQKVKTGSTSYELHYIFNNWSLGTITGSQTVAIYYDNVDVVGSWASSLAMTTSAQTGPTMRYAWSGTTYHMWGSTYVDYSTPYKTELKTEKLEAGNGTYDLTFVNISRTYAGVNYSQTISVYKYDGSEYFIPSDYGTYGYESCYVDDYPTVINITYGVPGVWFVYRTIDGESYNVSEGLPTAVPTAVPTFPPLTSTVTATPTPRPAYCGYWTAAPNATTIPRGSSVTTTLTETDPDDNFDRIDWYKVLPNGQKILRAQFINDPGLFGLGAGWISVDPVTNTPTSSSLAAAKSYTMNFDVSGTNKIVVEIYDDKSLVRTVYSDYQYGCGITLDINVGGPTGGGGGTGGAGPDGIPGTADDPVIDPGPDGVPGTIDDIYPDDYFPQIGINVWEMDTKAVVYDTTISVYSYDTGAWENKSNGYGGTQYFYVTPLKNIRIYVNKSPWVVFDQVIQVPQPPGTYGVYLKRPMTTTGTNTSWVVFAVKAADKLWPLSGASITVNNATWTSTITTNSAGGAQIELPEGNTYYYTISRYGYLKTTGSFTVPVDDYYPTVTMNVDPSAPPQYTPVPTEPIILTQATTSPTGTGTSTGGGGSGGTGGSGSGGTGGSGSGGSAARSANLDAGFDVWYDNFEFLMNFFFLLVIVGGLGLMAKSMPGKGGGGRRGRR